MVSSTAEMLWKATGEDNGLSQGREGGLENSSDWGPRHGLKQSLNPFRFTVSYVQQTASSGRITAFSGCSVTPDRDCLPGHNETPPQWRAAINECGHGRTAPEITECASCPLGICEIWCVCVWVSEWRGGGVWVCVYIYSLCILGHQGQTWLREELAQQNNAAQCSQHSVPKTTADQTGRQLSHNTACLRHTVNSHKHTLASRQVDRNMNGAADTPNHCV